MASRILIINGHPDAQSFGAGLVAAYAAGAARHEIRQIHIHQLEFNPNLQYGYRQRTELEPDLLAAREDILWAEHIVLIHPVWWGGLPALFKGFLDRTFLPGFAFKYRDNSVWWDKLLKGRTAHIICTLDQPAWYYRFINRRPAINQLKRMTLEFCGIKPVKVTAFGPVRSSTPAQREKWLQKVTQLAANP